MNKTYCPHCAKINEYNVTKPKFCGFCSKEFSKAFSPSEVTIAAPISEPIVNKQVIKVRPKIQKANAETEEGSDSYDLNDVQAMAYELMASISASDFVIQKGGNAKVTLGSLMNNPEKFQVGQRTSENSQSSSE
jgi:hypothetical protein